MLEKGTPKSDRTGTGTRSLFGHQLRYDLSAGFPLITTKKVHLKSVVYELLWFLRGDSNVAWLHEHGVTIWDEWASPTGDLGPVYGVQWRSWPTPTGEHVDQITAALDLLRTDPDSRRIIVSAWNVGEIPGWRCRPAMLSSSSTSQMESSAASSISAVQTFSWVCRSTSPATPC